MCETLLKLNSHQITFRNTAQRHKYGNMQNYISSLMFEYFKLGTMPKHVIYQLVHHVSVKF